jgi:hypothetical protein
VGLTEGVFPPVDPATFGDLPYRERIKILSRHWAEYGFGAPKITALIYIAKLLVFYVVIGATLITTTSGYSPFEPGQWWDQPIIWQKAVIWTMMLEALGLAGSWGPLAGHFKPMTGGMAYYLRRKTVRVPPWPGKVPGTAGTYRQTIDVVFYATFIGGLLTAILLSGSEKSGIAPEGLVRIEPLIVALVGLGLLGLRDKVSFLQARSEQYAPLLFFFVLFPLVDMIVAAKVLIVCIWFCAAFSKLGHHFIQVIPPMVSNTPWLGSKRIKRMHYNDFPEDLRPSAYGIRFTHVMGTMVEAGFPLVMLFSHNDTLTAIAAAGMIGFHLFIISTFPLAVPLEWNALFMYVTAFLFLGFPANEGFGVGDMDTALLVLVIFTSLFLPALGNNRPDLVSFLPSMRQYAGNWASAMWAFAPGKEKVLDDKIVKPALMQRQQLVPLYGEDEAEVIMQQLLGWRAMHSQGRGMNSVMMKTLGDDIDTYTLREAEFSCNAITGFNFGDGHFHNEVMLNGLQERCGFGPGEFIVVWVESEAVFRGYQDYFVWDAAVGVVERGRWNVAECVREQPWLPNGPVSTEVTWRLEGYQRVRHARPAKPPAAKPAEPVPA